MPGRRGGELTVEVVQQHGDSRRIRRCGATMSMTGSLGSRPAAGVLRDDPKGGTGLRTRRHPMV
jgi:hypothetical protein